MIKIINKKGITADVFFAAIKSTFKDFINDKLKTNLEFEFSKVEDTIIVSQPALKDKANYSITFSGDEVWVTGIDESYDVPLFEEQLIVFVHIAVDQSLPAS